jgi:hypothetical protein
VAVTSTSSRNGGRRTSSPSRSRINSGLFGCSSSSVNGWKSRRWELISDSR